MRASATKESLETERCGELRRRLHVPRVGDETGEAGTENRLLRGEAAEERERLGEADAARHRHERRDVRLVQPVEVERDVDAVDVVRRAVDRVLAGVDPGLGDEL